MKANLLLFFLVTLLIYWNVVGQSLEKEDLVFAYLEKSEKLTEQSPDSSLYYANKALHIASSISNDSLIAKSHLQKSSVLIIKRDFLQADSILRVNLQKDLDNDLKGQTWHNLGSIKYYQQDFQKALDLFLHAVEILEKSKNTKTIADTYANIGSINAILKNFDNALKYLEKALPLSDHNEMLRLKVLVNLNNLYLDQKLFSKFLDNIFDAETLAKKLKAKRMLAVIYNNLCNYYRDHEANFDLSIGYGKQGIVIKKELNLYQNLSINYNNIGYSYLKKNEYQNAITYLDSALPKAKGTLKTFILNNLKDAYIGLKDYKTAVVYADLKDKIKDSVNLYQQKEKVTELIEKYESEKKQQQIDNLDTKNKLQAVIIDQQKYQLLGVLILAVLVSFLAFFGFQNYKTKQQLHTILVHQRLLKTQLNPHFLFNALQSIQTFIFKNDKEKSASYLASYSKLIRLILEKSDDDFCSVAEDKQALTSYLQLQQLSENTSFTYEITADNHLDEDFELLPTFVTQPFVENAILHGLKDVENGLIKVSYYKKGNELHVSIKDNGKGFKERTETSKKLHKSMSMRIIRDQFKNLSKSVKKFKADIDIKSSTAGTEVLLTFKHL